MKRKAVVSFRWNFGLSLPSYLLLERGVLRRMQRRRRYKFVLKGTYTSTPTDTLCSTSRLTHTHTFILQSRRTKSILQIAEEKVGWVSCIHHLSSVIPAEFKAERKDAAECKKSTCFSFFRGQDNRFCKQSQLEYQQRSSRYWMKMASTPREVRRGHSWMSSKSNVRKSTFILPTFSFNRDGHGFCLSSRI